MEYTKTEWQDSPNTTTPITAQRLNNMEDGIEYLFNNTQIDAGTSGQRNWIKFSDGTMILSGIISGISVGANTQSSTNVSLPVQFATTSYIINLEMVGTVTNWQNVSKSYTVTSQSLFKIDLHNSSSSSINGLSFSYIAIGKWK